MSKTVTVTRKIQLRIVGGQEVTSAVLTKLYDWNEKIFRAANTICTHMYWQERQKDFFYLTDEAKILLSDATIYVDDIKSEKSRQMVKDGGVRIFNTSKQNTTYRLLSSKLKGDVPSNIFSTLNAQVAQTFSAESTEYFSGKRSLRSYKRGMPIPFGSSAVKNITESEDGSNYEFDWLDNIKFRTYFGRDLSGNKVFWKRYLDGDYKLCASAIQLAPKKIILLAVFQFQAESLQSEKALSAELSPIIPIIARWDSDKEFEIGTKDEFLYRRLAIQAARRRAQLAIKYISGGKGKGKKLRKVTSFKGKEREYVHAKIHSYSRKLINLCIANKCGKLVLKVSAELKVPDDLTMVEKREWIDKNQFLIRNWSYYGLIEKIKYKCLKEGIDLILEDS